MKLYITLFGLASLCTAVPATSGQLTVTSYTTTASANAFAPLDRSMYFEEYSAANASPAIVDAAGDWIGTNIGGLNPTWHWVGSAHIETETVFSSNNLAIFGVGAFSWDITTTPDFYSPNHVTSLYGPGAGANFSCNFTLNAPANYTLSGQLNRDGSVQLSSVSDGTFIYKKTNISALPFFVNASGTLPPGEYFVRANASLAGLGFIEGANHEVKTGSFTDFLFTVQVPEPAGGLAIAYIGLMVGLWRPRRIVVW